MLAPLLAYLLLLVLFGTATLPAIIKNVLLAEPENYCNREANERVLQFQVRTPSRI